MDKENNGMILIAHVEKAIKGDWSPVNVPAGAKKK
jgi:hypothetical protein